MSEEESEQLQLPSTKGVKRPKRRDLLISLALLLLLALIIIGVSLPVLLSCKGCGHGQAKAIRDITQWGNALFNFENDYGMYPNEETAEMLKKEYPDQAYLLKTETSNDFMRQLVIAGYMDGQDKRFGKDREAAMELLDSEEFNFAYVVGLKSSVNSAIPLLICPVKPGKKSLDDEFNYRSVVLRVDMSVSDPRIDSDFFDYSQPHWGGQKPRIVWPE